MSTQRTLFVALVVSLLANAFFIGFAATRWLGPPTEQARGGILHAVGGRLTGNLDEDSQERVAFALDRLEPDYRSNLAQRREDYRQLRALLAEAEVDRRAVDAVVDTMKNRSSELVVMVHEKAIDTILELPPEQRAVISGDD